LEALEKEGVHNFGLGQVIVATWEPNEAAVLRAIQTCGLELQVVFNKGAVMVLPSGINKASGLQAVLDQLGVSAHNTVAIGDAENDHALLDLSEASIAVANAVPMLKEHADWTTAGHDGAGVREAIEQLIENDLEMLESRLTRHHLVLGHRADNTPFTVPPYGQNLLVCGDSGSGKSTFATSFLEALLSRRYQFCVIDPEGDHHTLEQTTAIGSNNHHALDVESVMQLLEKPDNSVIVNMVDVPFEDRPKEFLRLLSRMQERRSQVGRPHWIVVDEAHHVLPAHWEPSATALPSTLKGMVLITLEPSLLIESVLAQVSTLIAVGPNAHLKIRRMAKATGRRLARGFENQIVQREGDVLVWSLDSDNPPFAIRGVPGETERRRHSRKYAEGELEPERSFYFRGADSKLNLRAQNLVMFLQLADGIDDETWLHHLHQQDYSNWFRSAIKDPTLAAAALAVEQDESLRPEESRKRIGALIKQSYTLPGAPAPAGTEVDEDA
jgi:hypothetical protein